MNLKKMMIGSALLMAACCMQAADKSNCSPRFLENPGIITKQYYITSKSRLYRLLWFRI